MLVLRTPILIALPGTGFAFPISEAGYLIIATRYAFGESSYLLRDPFFPSKNSYRTI